MSPSELKAKVKKMLDERLSVRKSGCTPPRYDSVYFDGLEVLNKISNGDQMGSCECRYLGCRCSREAEMTIFRKYLLLGIFGLWQRLNVCGFCYCAGDVAAGEY